MRKLIAFFVVAAVAVTSNQVFAQCATCAGSATPSFAQPASASPQVFSAPVQSYAAPVQSYAAPVESYSAPVAYDSAPVVSAPVEYSSAVPMEYGTPVASSGCSSCSSCCGGGMVTESGMTGTVVGGSVMSGEMSPYSTQGLPAGAVVISDVVSGDAGTVEGTVVGEPAAMEAGSPTDAVEPPAPEPSEDAAVDTLPTEDTDAAAASDGT